MKKRKMDARQKRKQDRNRQSRRGVCASFAL